VGGTFEDALSVSNFLDLLREEQGSGCRIAIIDSGASSKHPVSDYTNLTDKSLTDTEEHGRYIHEAIYKILPEAEIFIVKIPDPTPDHILVTALKEAVKFKPHAINLSISSEYPSDGTDPISHYVNHISKTTIVTIAAGNGGPKLMSIGPPAVAEEALTVGGATVQGRLWRRSGRGPTLDGRWKPNVVAPTNYTLGHLLVSGTSFAAPIATALAALLNRDVKDSYAVRKLIELTARPIPVSTPHPLTMQGTRKQSLIKKLIEAWPRLTDPRNHTGMGIIDAGRARETARRLRGFS